MLTLLELLRADGQQPFVLTRGYRGTLQGPVLVDASKHSATEVGDEPLLLSATAPVVVSADRVAGAKFAVEHGASVVVMDDGFQNPSLVKQLSLVVVDAARGLGNGSVFPAGPLRAPFVDQLERTGALVIVGEGSAADRLASAVARRGAPVLHAHLIADQADVASLSGSRVLAFAGIGDPGKFFATLRASGIDVVATRSFADHHAYRKNELSALRVEAKEKGLTLVTTAKDLARLGSAAAGISVLKVSLVFEDQAAVRQLVARAVHASMETA